MQFPAGHPQQYPVDYGTQQGPLVSGSVPYACQPMPGFPSAVYAQAPYMHAPGGPPAPALPGGMGGLHGPNGAHSGHPASSAIHYVDPGPASVGMPGGMGFTQGGVPMMAPGGGPGHPPQPALGQHMAAFGEPAFDGAPGHPGMFQVAPAALAGHPGGPHSLPGPQNQPPFAPPMGYMTPYYVPGQQNLGLPMQQHSLPQYPAFSGPPPVCAPHMLPPLLPPSMYGPPVPRPAVYPNASGVPDGMPGAHPPGAMHLPDGLQHMGHGQPVAPDLPSAPAAPAHGVGLAIHHPGPAAVDPGNTQPALASSALGLSRQHSTHSSHVSLVSSAKHTDAGAAGARAGAEMSLSSSSVIAPPPGLTLKKTSTESVGALVAGGTHSTPARASGALQTPRDALGMVGDPITALGMSRMPGSVASDAPHHLPEPPGLGLNSVGATDGDLGVLQAPPPPELVAGPPPPSAAAGHPFPPPMLTQQSPDGPPAGLTRSADAGGGAAHAHGRPPAAPSNAHGLPHANGTAALPPDGPPGPGPVDISGLQVDIAALFLSTPGAAQPLPSPAMRLQLQGGRTNAHNPPAQGALPACPLAKLDQDCLALVGKLEPSGPEVSTLLRACDSIKDALYARYHGATLLLFGSVASGLCLTHTNDLDLSLRLPGCDSREEKEAMVAELEAYLKESDMAEVVGLPGARIPLVKLVVPSTRTAADITINNELPLHNTQLVRAYAEIDDRVKGLIFLVKHWAKQRNIANAYQGTLSSYAWVLLCIFVAQQTGLVPVLQQVEPKDVHVEVQLEGETWLCAYNSDVARHAAAVKDHPITLAGLLTMFFDYYAYRFDFIHEVVCPAQGRTLAKEELGWTTKVNNEKHLCCIQDPFLHIHDLGRTVGLDQRRHMQRELQRASKLMYESPDPLHELMWRAGRGAGQGGRQWHMARRGPRRPRV